MFGKLIVGIVLLGLGGVVWGAGTVFSDRAAFEAAVGSVKRYSFDPADGFATAPAPIPSVDGGFLQFTSNGGPASLDAYGAAPNQALTGRLNNQVDRSAPFSIIPAGHQNAIGFDILDLGSPAAEAASILISDNTDRFISPIQIQDNDGNPATPVFFGIIWDTDMTAVDVWAENLICAGPGVCYTPNLIDNLTVAPEPGALMLI
ncbi:MAG TPA: hypothetical protein VGP99_07660, partial [Tepidisphaeraceae bacterium]|nr:hypothetical protein [Tepidisphaeraceae bacterium]